MKFALKPLASLNGLVLAGLLATAGVSAMAQGAPAGPQAGHMGRHDPAKMQAWIAQRQAELKAQLKLTPAQEGAWTRYTATMQPTAHGARLTPEQRAEFDKLSTPERIDKMRALRTQRMADMSAVMDKRDAATKTFYAALSPEQQKIFDAEHRKYGPRGHHEGTAPRKG